MKVKEIIKSVLLELAVIQGASVFAALFVMNYALQCTKLSANTVYSIGLAAYIGVCSLCAMNIVLKVTSKSDPKSVVDQSKY